MSADELAPGSQVGSLFAPARSARPTADGAREQPEAEASVRTGFDTREGRHYVVLAVGRDGEMAQLRLNADQAVALSRLLNEAARQAARG